MPKTIVVDDLNDFFEVVPRSPPRMPRRFANRKRFNPGGLPHNIQLLCHALAAAVREQTGVLNPNQPPPSVKQNMDALMHAYRDASAHDLSSFKLKAKIVYFMREFPADYRQLFCSMLDNALQSAEASIVAGQALVPSASLPAVANKPLEKMPVLPRQPCRLDFAAAGLFPVVRLHRVGSSDVSTASTSPSPHCGAPRSPAA